MTQLSVQEFADLTFDWAAANVATIRNCWPQKGGWEGWAQADIFGWLMARDTTFDVLREQPVYQNPLKRADFVLNSQSLQGHRVVVELKAQSLENWKNFVPGLQQDVHKLLHELQPAWQQASLLVVGLYFTQYSDIPGYFSKKVVPGGEIGVCWAIDES